jgi:hypothetical protein
MVRALAVVGALAIVAGAAFGWLYWTEFRPRDWPQPAKPITFDVAGVQKLVKFSMHGTGAPALGPDFHLVLLVDGTVLLDVADDGGTMRRQLDGRITDKQATVLQRAVGSAQFMHLPTQQTLRHMLEDTIWDAFDLDRWIKPQR